MEPARLTAVLLHGLDGTGRLWDPVASRWDRGGAIAPDLAGHGTASTIGGYEIRDHAEDLHVRLAQMLPADPLMVVGHSLGAIIASELVPMLAADDVNVTRTVLLSIKTSWTTDDVAALQRPAERGHRHYPDREAAGAAYLRLTGLTGVLEPDAPAVLAGLRQHPDGWTFAADPNAHRLTPPDVTDLAARIGALPCPVTLARGTSDPYASIRDMEALGQPVEPLPGSGHNPHVDNPAQVAALLRAVTT